MPANGNARNNRGHGPLLQINSIGLYARPRIGISILQFRSAHYL